MPGYVTLNVQSQTRPIVAVYCDQGVWPAGRESVEHMLTAHRLSWQRVKADDVNQGDLGRFDVFWLPGGWSGDYWSRITTQGMERMRQFVHRGGRLVGICAGAFFASGLIVWEGETFDYPVGLFAGQTVGPITEIAPWPQCAMTTVSLNPQHPINSALPPTRQQLYYGGPIFIPNGDQPVDVVATYAQIGEIASITFQYGRGRVFLSGLHFETGPDCVRRGNVDVMPAPESDWEFGWALLDWLLN